MKFGLAFANTGVGADPRSAVELARLGESYGYDSIWALEHVAVPAAYRSAYPYSLDGTGRMANADDAAFPDPLLWLSWIGASTTTIKLATGVHLLPLHHPLIAAKQLATLDHMSHGRMLYGVGVGWLREEFDLIGVPFDARGRRCEEYIAALRALWARGPSSFAGEFVSFERVHCCPKPTQRNGIPVILGGHSVAAAERAGRIGNGFFVAAIAVDQIRDLIAVMVRAALAADRDPGTIEVTAGGAFDCDSVRRLADIGVHRVIVPLGNRDYARTKRAITSFAERVLLPIAELAQQESQLPKARTPYEDVMGVR